MVPHERRRGVASLLQCDKGLGSFFHLGRCARYVMPPQHSLVAWELEATCTSWTHKNQAHEFRAKCYAHAHFINGKHPRLCSKSWMLYELPSRG